MKKVFLNITIVYLFVFGILGFSIETNYFENFGSVALLSNKNIRIGSNNTKISAERAKEIALNHARVSASVARFTKIKLDNEDGSLVYEIKFFVKRAEYEYVIDANTGEILEFEIEE